MKKIAALFALVLTMSACTDEITRNNPGFEGLKNGDSWRAADVTAVRSANGTVVLTGLTQYESLVLKTSSALPSTYTLGTGIANQASFLINQNTQEISYQTGINKGEGQIIITEFDDVNQTITGSFEFKAPKLGPTLPTDLEPAELHFQKGIFYKIPVEPSL
ncbi:DUF6252 family protein [Flavobacterium ardleyense]|uniref:DUF6252 family protein n=1 Tax=Flavobacterium ardleyense TaxID=2038737 RepID=UPI00298D5160|nr:DUF6252 family protein [Flavobacterium ardleyense]